MGSGDIRRSVTSVRERSSNGTNRTRWQLNPGVYQTGASPVCHFRKLGMRRVDFMKKGVGADMEGLDIRDVVRRYVTQTDHGCSYLSKKSVIALHPAPFFASAVWATRRLTSR